MYNVLLVDDERIILDGISRMVDWSSLQTELMGTARNGVEAFEIIQRQAPDIIISDIRMPGMDGLELVARVHEAYPHIRFVLLSGFGEFDYASRAMQYGVKHYLLKPTNEGKIGEALKEIVAELEQETSKESFVRNMKAELEKVMPHVKEQFLKEFVTNKTYGKVDWDYFRSLFKLDFDYQIRLLLFQLEEGFEFELLFAIKNIAQEILVSPLLSTTIGNHVLILLEESDHIDQLHERIYHIRDTFQSYYKRDVTIALSEPSHITQARTLYRQCLHLLNYRFYLGEGSLITRKDTEGSQEASPKELGWDEERLNMSVRSGHREEAEAALRSFIGGLKEAQLDIDVTKSYVIQQFVSLVRQCAPEEMNHYFTQIPLIVEMNTLQTIQTFMENVVITMTERFYGLNKVKHSAIVQKVIDVITSQLGNSELSLNWVAHEMLYMNADYLGKLFKKETGEKFSNYVMKARINRATELIAEDADIKIFELAERLGFGDNPQYFSQVFKKYRGSTPSEYMKSTDTSAF
ncbi:MULTISPECIES: response regulator transcription factor [unclassified Paenibacillus]|uniref:response regulator transcription factor n=1 Tax=unclassified Paenibacillus TaxID=185978 RepID=UPI0006FA6D59|nr:response regulator transcription factor [Paenibacillus sp. Soil750]KRE71384.1 AraC family transcriptional regulator [Paenibacillus sp. Soil750]